MTINKNTISFPFDHGDMQMRVAYTAAGDPEYIGRRAPTLQPALTSVPEWQIKKITYDANRNPTAVQFASGTNDYKSIWDDRATYVYS
jgi:hypothetical protein